MFHVFLSSLTKIIIIIIIIIIILIKLNVYAKKM